MKINNAWNKVMTVTVGNTAVFMKFEIFLLRLFDIFYCEFVRTCTT